MHLIRTLIEEFEFFRDFFIEKDWERFESPEGSPVLAIQRLNAQPTLALLSRLAARCWLLLRSLYVRPRIWPHLLHLPHPPLRPPLRSLLRPLLPPLLRPLLRPLRLQLVY